MKKLLGTSKNGVSVYELVNNEHMGAHSDISSDIVAEAVAMIDIDGSFFMESVAFDRAIGTSDLVVNNEGDDIRMQTRKGRKGLSPINYSQSPTATNLLTVGICKDDDDLFTVFTAFAGEKAPKEPWDASLSDSDREISEEFWSKHSLCYKEGMLEE